MTEPELDPKDLYEPFCYEFGEELAQKKTKDDPYKQGYIKGFIRALTIYWKMNPNRGKISPSELNVGVEDFFKTLGHENAELVLELIERIGPSVIYK